MSSIFGGMDEIVQNRELLDFILPVLRNDVMLVETYSHKHAILSLSCPVSVFNGKMDKLVQENDCNRWAECSSGDYSIHEYDDGHFFIRTFKEEIVSYINKVLNNLH
jgi:surfactin synthase thioesterase subunit